MKVKRIVFIAFLFLFAYSVVWAQDDMYFTPTKSDKKEIKQEKVAVYGGSARDVDEYNRRGQFASSYFNLDSDTLYSDVIGFVPDSISAQINDSIVSNDDFDYTYTPEDDYYYTRRMCRYDDFYWYDPWWYGSYWYRGPYWYAGWWYDPWYDPWYYGWHRPWGWYYPGYWYGSYYRPYVGVTGTMNHGRFYGNRGKSTGRFNGNRGVTNGRYNGRYTGRRYNNTNNDNQFNGRRQNNNMFRNTQSRPTYNSSFGGNRGGGGSFRGGSFGGSRGGGSFRGRR